MEKTSLHNNLFFTSAGDSNHRIPELWMIEPKCQTFDIVIYYYGNSEERFQYYQQIATHCVRRKGLKFNNFHHFYQHNSELVLSYEYCAIFDDDIMIDTRSLQTCFSLMKEYHLLIGQPSNHPTKGEISWWKCTHQIPDAILHYVSVIENGVVLFDTTVIDHLFGKDYPIELQAWGSDFYYLNVIPNPTKDRFAVFDTVTYINPTMEEKGLTIRETKKDTPNERFVWEKIAKQKNYRRVFTNEIYNIVYSNQSRQYRNNESQIIQGLWIGSELSKMEQLSIQSFLSNGHVYHLYHYQPIANVPKGAILKDANEIIPESEIYRYKNGSVSAFSNLFRFTMLYKLGGYWADTDLVCIKPFFQKKPYLIVTEPNQNFTQNVITSCLIKMPKDSEAAKRGIEIQLQNKAKILSGEMEWGSGPSCVRQLVKEFTLEEYVLPWQTVSTTNWNYWYSLIKPEHFYPKQVITKREDMPRGMIAVHLWHEMWRKQNLDKNQRFHIMSLFEQLKILYGIETEIVPHQQLSSLRSHH